MNIQFYGASCSVRKDGSTIPKCVLLERLYTEPEYRGKGQAKRLLRLVKNWAKRKGVSVLLYIGAFADRPMNNGQLFRFYTKMGFVPYKPWHETHSQFMIWNYHHE